MLAGIRILDLTRVMAGPYCTAMLADVGAEVIKLEMPDRGDDARHLGHMQDGISTCFLMLNRGKKSLTLNLKSDEGVDILGRLIAESDVLVENFRPGVMARLGLDYERAKAINSKLIYASITGFGQESPLAEKPAYDLMIQAMSGLMSLTGFPDGPPTAVGESVADVCSGMFTAWGIMVALHNREKTGEGCMIDTSMLDSLYAMSLTGLSQLLYSGDNPRRVGNRHPQTYPVDAFETKDGYVTMVVTTEKIFAGLAEGLGCPEICDDPKFSDNRARNLHEKELKGVIEDWTRQYSSDEVVDHLAQKGVPVAPLWSLEQVASSEHIAARGMTVTGHHPILGDMPLVPQPLQFSGQTNRISGPPPELGEHTDVVLSELLRMGPEEIDGLRDQGII